jgi:membrane fusion protein (multidrug efflux system)
MSFFTRLKKSFGSGFVRKTFILFFVGLCVFLLFHFFGGAPKKKSEVAHKPTTVQVEGVMKGPIARQTTLSGEVKAIDSIAVIVPTQGVVAEIRFKEGEMVKKGDLLIRLDDAQARAELYEARARLKEAEGAYHRAKELDRRGFGSSSDVEKAYAQMNVAKAQVDKARFMLSQTRVVAPFDGYMSIRHVSLGAFVTPNQEIANLVSLDPLYVDFSVPESLYSSLTLGSEISVTIPGGDILPYSAKIAAINPSVDSVSRNVTARATLGNKDNVLRPGMFAQVSLPLGREESALLVPENSVMKDGDRSFVFVVKGGRADQRSVVLGLKEGENVQVVDGLEEGEQVVTEGLFKIYDGAPVRVIPKGEVN